MEDKWFKIPAGDLEKALYRLRSEGVQRISSITGLDTGEALDIIYHLLKRGQSINIRVSLPRQNPQIRTITPIYPGAELFEREVSEMLGVKILGHPDPRRLFLPEDWKGRPPYRK
jgi:NADH:ubiquinone oxidoreductase subunit C